VGDCFHYVLMDPSDPELWRTLDVWKRKGGFVAVMEISDYASVSACRLNEEAFEYFERYRDRMQTPDPEAFREFTQSVLEHKALENRVLAQLESEGRTITSTPVVEIQVLTAATVRGAREFGTRCAVGDDSSTRDDESPKAKKQVGVEPSVASVG